MSKDNLNERLVQGVKNMLSKREITQEYFEIKADIGHAFQTKDILIYIPQIDGQFVSKIKNDIVQLIFSLMTSLRITHAIVLYDQIAPQARGILSDHSVFEIEMFKYKMILFDPTIHEKTPRHILMSREQVEQELPKIKLKDLPRISESDAIVRFYNWKPDQIVKISRKEGPYYRLISRD